MPAPLAAERTEYEKAGKLYGDTDEVLTDEQVGAYRVVTIHYKGLYTGEQTVQYATLMSDLPVTTDEF